MLKRVFAAALLGAGATSAQAVTYVAEISGTVTARHATFFTAAGQTPLIALGETITARFTYSTGSDAAIGMAGPSGRRLAMTGDNLATFELGGHRWTSRGDMLDGLVAPLFAEGDDPMAGFTSTMDDAPGGGDLAINGYSFEIGEFGYDLYEGFGYAGSFDRSSLRVFANGQLMSQGRGVHSEPFAFARRPSALNAVTAVPEPANWAMLILGFGAVGAMFRRARQRSRTLRFA